VPIVGYTLLAAVNFNQMTEQEQKHWFELGKQVERNERTYFTSKEFWFGIILGMLTMYSLIAFGIF
jgi:hypothetical protein